MNEQSRPSVTAHDPSGQDSAQSVAARRRIRLKLTWAAIGLVLCVGLVGVLMVVNLTSPSQASTGTATAAQEPGISKAAATLLQLVPQSEPLALAPGLTLTDQSGRQVSLAQFHGKAVVLSFNDDQCEDLCTLLAQDVTAANQDLGKAASNVVFLSINANPYYPSVNSVKTWTDNHGLSKAGNWVFATGSAKQLAAVAHAYAEPVELDAKHRTIQHGADLYFIDPSGREAAIGQFGTESANTSLFGHVMAQATVDLLPNAGSIHVGGPSPADPTGQASSRGGSGGALNTTAPAFTLPSLATKTKQESLSSLRGTLTVLNFWSSTCAACVQELPDLEKAHHDLGKTAAFIGVDVADGQSSGQTFAAKYHVDYPLLSDNEGTVAGSYQVPGLPFTVILDASGNVLVRHAGTFTTEQIEYLIQSLAPAVAN